MSEHSTSEAVRAPLRYVEVDYDFADQTHRNCLESEYDEKCTEQQHGPICDPPATQPLDQEYSQYRPSR